MSENAKQPSGRDLAAGIALADLADGALLQGHVGDDAVLLARRGDELFALGAECTHYHGPLAEGLMVGDTVRCPWHHACFSLRTGEAVRAPAFDPLARWRVERQGDRVVVREKLAATPKPSPTDADKRAWPAAPPPTMTTEGGVCRGLAATRRSSRFSPTLTRSPRRITV